MTAVERQNIEVVRVLAQAQGLDLPEERLETLAQTFGDFMTRFAAVWEIEPGGREPAAITFDDEAR